jgi:putative ABC transport system substrate-binding protein
MRRRNFMAGLAGAAAWPLAARAQQPVIPTIGFLDNTTATSRAIQVLAQVRSSGNWRAFGR